MKSTGIYVHFPFCVKKCKYCNFNSFDCKEHLQLDYFQALLREIKMYANKNIKVDTVFIGGGTPSVMFDGCISTLLSEIRKNLVYYEPCQLTLTN